MVENCSYNSLGKDGQLADINLGDDLCSDYNKQILIGEFALAKAALQKILSQDQSNFQALDKLTDILLFESNFAEATLLLKRALKQNPDNVDFYYKLAEIALSSGKDQEKALSYIEKGLKLVPNSELLLIRRCEILCKLGYIRKSISSAKECLVIFPKSVAIITFLANLLQSIGDYYAEKETLERAVREGVVFPEFEERIEQIKLSKEYNTKQELFPRVSIVIPTCSADKHLHSLFDSIEKQSYPYFDIIIIDDFSSFNWIESFKSKYPDALYFQSKSKLGYAAACNLGLDLACSEFVAFLNDDTKVDSNWLKSLVSRINQDKNIAIVSSKIIFWHKFIPLHIESDCPLTIDKTALFESISEYPKAFINSDLNQLREGLSWRLSCRARILVPQIGTPIRLKLRKLAPDLEKFPAQPDLSEKPIKISIKAGEEILSYSLENDILDISINPLNRASIEETNVINNAGSEIDISGNARDLGFGWPDRKQHDKPIDLSAFCGCSFLLRRSCLQQEPLFIEDFHAYWEDTELSLRLKQKGFRITYEPNSIVRHLHASSSLEHSDYYWKHVIRNHILVLHLHFNQHLADRSLKKWRSFLKNDLQKPLLANEISHEIQQLLPKFSNQLHLQRKTKILRFGIYNEYWSTFGGAERRALEIATVLQKYGIVELISREDDYTIEQLENRFGLNLKGARKVICKDISSLSSSYDIFFNSTHGSLLESRSARSIYLASFPQGNIDAGQISGLDTYTQIWSTSFYTAKYIKGRWKRNSLVVYPGCNIPINSELSQKKEKLFLSVGRFFETGHCKKQFEIVKAFQAWKAQDPLKTKEWKLILAGGIQDQNYYQQVVNEVRSSDIEIVPNVDLNALISLYQRASFLVHATGLEEDPRDNPERMEHFGITIIEAMSRGCVPIVYKYGGPDEIAGKDLGYRFNSLRHLVERFTDAHSLFEHQTNKYIDQSQKCSAHVESFSTSKITENIERLLKSYFPDLFENTSSLLRYLDNQI